MRYINISLIVFSSLLTAVSGIRADDNAVDDNAVVEDTDSTVSGDASCIPACREGYVCHGGACIYACNPVCPAGTGCLSNGQCVPVLAVQPSPPVSAADPTLQFRQEQARNRQLAVMEALEQRKANRFKPRLTLNLKMTLLAAWEQDDYGWGGGIGVGLRKNLTDIFGLHLQVNGVVGGLTRSYSYYGYDAYYGYSHDQYYSREVFFGAVDGEVIPFFGPFGRFYVGAILFAGGFWYDKDEYEDENDYVLSSADDVLNSGFMAGAGIDMGVFLGRREQIDLNWRFKSAFFIEDMPTMFEIGVTFHFMKDQ